MIKQKRVIKSEYREYCSRICQLMGEKKNYGLIELVKNREKRKEEIIKLDI